MRTSKDPPWPLLWSCLSSCSDFLQCRTVAWELQATVHPVLLQVPLFTVLRHSNRNVSVCMHTCTCICPHMCRYTCTCMCSHAREDRRSTLFMCYCSGTMNLVFWFVCYWNLGLGNQAGLAGQWDSGFCLFLVARTGTRSRQHHRQLFMWALEIKPRSSGWCSKYFPTESSPQQPNSPAKPSLTAVIFYLTDCFEQLAHFSNASLSYIQIQYTFPFLSSSGFLFFLSWPSSLLCIVHISHFFY